MRIKKGKLLSSKADSIMKCIMPRTQPSLQINISVFLQTNGWISYITKSHFKIVELFWTHIRIANNVASYHGLSGHQPCSQDLFPNAKRFIGFLLQLITLLRKEAMGARLNGNASLLSFLTQEEQTVFIR